MLKEETRSCCERQEVFVCLLWPRTEKARRLVVVAGGSSDSYDINWPKATAIVKLAW